MDKSDLLVEVATKTSSDPAIEAPSLLVSIVGLFVLGSIAKQLLSDEPKLNLRVLFGEMILSGIAGVAMYSLGLMREMSTHQIIFFGALGGIGGWRTVLWIIKIIKSNKN
ncbi:hypothetical protein [Photobacterium ganghwense]|uniref:Holin n=1 Tax=Photobacterium ganghwense TaxID=320778 RepID=A0A0J1K771_9GAMM|nr:hypothetical protein [Photobacterium ganghwense]KLV10182.1 hypothetical protein ABT57_06290 [Photobacterium ganghwense]PSU05432.1 hypothetical protein C9I92_21845 [Photobacterium ganghwense]QSV17192.1 hypothetical protein FH974_19835 [Photobacterium ganghwense]